MAKLAYLECPTGLAGDMCLGALVDAGVPLAYLIDQLGRLGLSREYQLRSELVHRNGQQATKVHVELLTPPETNGSAHEHGHDQGTRHLPEIEVLIRSAELPHQAEAWSLAVFRQLAAAEAAVHGIPPEQVHFHEVGATDAIVDIVGTCLGLDWLDIDHLYCSALPTGGGTIRAAHGRLPVPAPAVLKLWEMRQVPIYSNGIDRELVTPTGAAIATTLAAQFGPPPPMTLQRVGLGAGSQNLSLPNILRLWIGEGEPQTTRHHHLHSEHHHDKNHPHEKGHHHSKDPHHRHLEEHHQGSVAGSELGQEAIAVLETQLDDLNPQAIGYVFEALFAAGAVDVFTQAIGMKKSRPGILLTAICPPDRVRDCETVLFRETTTLGIRCSLQQRSILPREFHTVALEQGTVRVKVARWQRGGAIANVQPEYEDCAHLAQQSGLPWRDIHQSALQQWHLQQSDSHRSIALEHSAQS